MATLPPVEISAEPYDYSKHLEELVVWLVPTYRRLKGKAEKSLFLQKLNAVFDLYDSEPGCGRFPSASRRREVSSFCNPVWKFC